MVPFFGIFPENCGPANGVNTPSREVGSRLVPKTGQADCENNLQIPGTGKN
jgi:hypothetical protein